MKKIIITLLGLLCMGMLSAQVIFEEDFDNIPGPTAGGAGTYSFPTDWLLMNVDNNTPAAGVSYVNEAWERREDNKFNVADSCAFSTSWYSPAGTSDDWMWTPQIDNLPTNCKLTWNAVAYDFNYPDGYEVRIMELPNTPTGGTGVLGNMVTNSTLLFNINAESPTWTSHTVDLSAYQGKSIRIAFRNNSNDKNILLIDDVKIELVASYDGQLVSVSNISEYTQIPLSQVSALTLGGKIKNNGVNPLTGVKLNIKVYNDLDEIVYNGQSATADLNPTVEQYFTASSSFALDAVGNYTLEYFVSANEGDLVPENDTLYSTFMASDSVYARDNGISVGNAGIGDGIGGYIGQDFEILQGDTLTSITVSVNGGYTGKPIAAVIWDMLNDMPNEIYALTDTLQYTDNLARVYTLPVMGKPLLIPGRYAITMCEIGAETLQLAQTVNNFTMGRTWINFSASGGWQNNEYFGEYFKKSFYIRPNFANTPIVIDDQVFNSRKETINISPNPTKGLVKIDLGDSYENVNILISNTSGEVVYESNNMTGQSFTLNLNEPAGLYFIKLSTQKNSSIFKLIIE